MENSTYDYRTDAEFAVVNGIVDAPEVWGVQPSIEQTWDEDEQKGSFPALGIIDTTELDGDTITVQYGADGINIWSGDRDLKAQFAYNDLIQVALREMMVENEE